MRSRGLQKVIPIRTGYVTIIILFIILFNVAESARGDRSKLGPGVLSYTT